MNSHWSIGVRRCRSGLVLLALGGLYLHSLGSRSRERETPCAGAFDIRGLYEPRVVSGNMQIRAVPCSAIAMVYFYIDGKEVERTSNPPFDLKLRTGAQSGLDSGPHVLLVRAIGAQGKALRSNPIWFTVVPDLNERFSAQLSAYALHPSVLDEDLEVLLRSTASERIVLSSAEVETRRLVFGMYLNLGIDPSLDSGNDRSELLAARLPAPALPLRTRDQQLAPSMWFSPDSVFYHAIPKDWPRVALPKGYIKQTQFSTAYHGDGIGFGEVVASASDMPIEVSSQWYDVRSTRRVFKFRMPVNWISRLPTQKEGDRHVIFMDPASNSFISSYKTSMDKQTGGPKALYVSSPHSFDGLGDSGGSVAAGFAELPILIQPGEATDPGREIPHALGGAVGRTWAARVYPATSRDAGVLTSVNPCTHSDYTNSGVVPYGGIIQLDPNLDLTRVGLSLPAYRILRAIQLYGYYVMDFGCGDLDIYTAIDSNELEPYGGPWGNDNGPGIQNEILHVLTQSTLYVVPPPIKR